MVNGGGALIHCPSLLSADGKYIIVAASASVRLHSAVTAEPVQILHGHLQDVTSIVLDDSSDNKVQQSLHLSYWWLKLFP